MNISFDVSKNRNRAGEMDCLVRPIVGDRSQRWPIVWCHGYLGDYKPGPVEYFVADKLWSPWVCTDLGGTKTWAGPTITNGTTGVVEGDRAWAVSAMGAKNGKLVLVGGSMGGLNAIAFALNNPTKVAAVHASIPAFDIEYARANNVGGSKTDIEAVYGVGTVPLANQIYTRGADFAATGVPLRIVYSTTDIYTPVASTLAFIAASGCQSRSLGAVGHNYLTADVDEIVNFLSPYL